MTEYAIYRGDEFIMIGTAKECAEEAGVKPSTIRWLTYPTSKKRQSKQNLKNGLVVVKLEDE